MSRACSTLWTDAPALIVAPNDFLHLYYPEYFSRGQLIQRKWAYRRAIDRADLVVVGGQSTLRDLVEHYPAAAGKAVVWRFPAPMDLRQPSAMERRMAERLRGPVRGTRATILYPAQFWPHKNHETLIRAIAVLRREYGMDVGLLLTGTGEAQERAIGLSRREEVQDRVLLLGNVPRGVLFALLAEATIVAVPSLFEQASYPLI